ncbi:MAG: hypothetical protein ACTTKD_00405 [Peptoanaerobacter stomatis]|uniref:hypothetical protein n=1 Tax=Peptoanaerobacter stomatis TaxID=796937 RepID=UPI003FA14F82
MDNQKLELIESISEYASNLIEYMPQIVDSCRKQKVEEMYKDFIDLTDGLVWLNDALKLTYNIHKIDNNFLNDVYTDFIAAIENKDYFLIADILEYDLISKLAEVKNIVCY